MYPYRFESQPASASPSSSSRAPPRQGQGAAGDAPGPLNICREGAAHALGEDGCVYVTGGCPIFGEDAVDSNIYGTSFEKVLRLSTLSAQWDALDCHGDVPLPRHHHTMVYYRGALIVCGGELLNPPDSVTAVPDTIQHQHHNNKRIPTTTSSSSSNSYHHPLRQHVTSASVPFSLESADSMSIYILNLQTLGWTRYKGQGEVPTDRCFHSACIVGSTMLLCGGRPILRRNEALGITEHLDNEGMLQLRRACFFDLHVLHLSSAFPSSASLVWQKIPTSRNDPMRTPFLWGHTMLCRDDSSTVLVFGGMDVRGSGEVAAVHPLLRGQDAPEAELNTSVYSLDTRTMLWERVRTGYGEAEEVSMGRSSVGQPLTAPDAPTPAIDQTALFIPNSEEVLLMGGWTVVPALDGGSSARGGQGEGGGGGVFKSVSEMCVFNIPSRTWRRIPCPSTRVFGGRVVACARGSHLIVVAKTHASVYALDCHVNPRVQGWQVFDSFLSESFKLERIAAHQQARHTLDVGLHNIDRRAERFATERLSREQHHSDVMLLGIQGPRPLSALASRRVKWPSSSPSATNSSSGRAHQPEGEEEGASGEERDFSPFATAPLLPAGSGRFASDTLTAGSGGGGGHVGLCAETAAASSPHSHGRAFAPHFGADATSAPPAAHHVSPWNTIDYYQRRRQPKEVSPRGKDAGAERDDDAVAERPTLRKTFNSSGRDDSRERQRSPKKDSTPHRRDRSTSSMASSTSSSSSSSSEEEVKRQRRKDKKRMQRAASTHATAAEGTRRQRDRSCNYGGDNEKNPRGSRHKVQGN